MESSSSRILKKRRRGPSEVPFTGGTIICKLIFYQQVQCLLQRNSGGIYRICKFFPSLPLCGDLSSVSTETRNLGLLKLSESFLADCPKRLADSINQNVNWKRNGVRTQPSFPLRSRVLDSYLIRLLQQKVGTLVSESKSDVEQPVNHYCAGHPAKILHFGHRKRNKFN